MDDWNEDTIPHKVIVVDTLLIPIYHVKKKKRRDWKYILGIIWLVFTLLLLLAISAYLVWLSMTMVNWRGN